MHFIQIFNRPFNQMLYFLGIVLFFFGMQTAYSARFLAISDIHYGSKNIVEQNHDTDEQLLQLAMTKFAGLANSADFIVNLGDLPTHGYYPVHEKETYEKIVFQSLYKADRGAKPMFYIPGNNDSLAGNYQPFSQKGRSPLSLAEDWQGACSHCDNLIINQDHMYDDGYYSSYVIPGNKDLILIVLNSTQFMDPPAHYPSYPNQEKDASTQLQWFEKQLSEHQAKQLLIAMHEPPGYDYQGKPYWQAPYLRQFLTLLKNKQAQYQQITLLTSHTHMDEIRKISLDSKHNIYAFSTPSLSPIHHNNPAMKMFKLGKDLKLENFTTYYTESPNQWLGNHYYAIGKKTNSIFPECQGLNLATCLNSLSNDKVCEHIEAGLFYGVKNPAVDNSACSKIYQVN